MELNLTAIIITALICITFIELSKSGSSKKKEDKQGFQPRPGEKGKPPIK